MRNGVTTLLDIVGGLLLVLGSYLIYVPLAPIVAGILFLLASAKMVGSDK